MALSPTRTRLVRFDIDRVIDKNTRVVKRVMDRLAVEIEVYLKSEVTAKHYPPASTPGTYPAKRKGKFAGSIQVTNRGRALTIRVMQRGIWLETGTGAKAKQASQLAIPLRKALGRGGRRKVHRTKRSGGPGGMAPRPWMTLGVFRQRDKWFRRATELRREEMAKS